VVVDSDDVIAALIADPHAELPRVANPSSAAERIDRPFVLIVILLLPLLGTRTAVGGIPDTVIPGGPGVCGEDGCDEDGDDGPNLPALSRHLRGRSAVT
jgi:hypothetical protein